ncbi:MAG: cytochrome c3 family protein [Deltaproteobacteria bacterium]|nr:cytochrome c3 family protein [Deltaproteobacteria bacterium]
MPKAVTVCVCAMIMAIFGVVLNVSGQTDEDLCIPMGTIILEPPEGIEQKRSSVDFPHSVHFDYACRKCHHTWSGRQQVQNCTTSGCHDLLKTLKTSQTDKIDQALVIRYYKKAYHEMCIGCHKDIKKKNKELEFSKKNLDEPLAMTGPTGCVKCHPKAE